MDAGGLILYARLLRFFLKQCGEQRADQQEDVGNWAVAEEIGNILRAVTQGFHITSLRFGSGFVSLLPQG